MPIEDRMQHLITEETRLLHEEIHHLAARVLALETALEDLRSAKTTRPAPARRA